MVDSVSSNLSSSSALSSNSLVDATDTYQVGGSLRLGASSYIHRQADDVLFDALTVGEYCYVFNARQMGKSSLRVRMQQRLVEAGKCCASLDMTSIGSERVTPLQWYKGMMVDLLTKLELRSHVNFQQWWKDRSELSMVQRLRLFLEEIVLRHLPDQDIYIFVDEIDSALALDFPVDDFFALIRYCYDQRAEQPAFRRLTWSLFGVVTPSDLIRDSLRTPFNVGRGIELRGLVFEDAQALAEGLAGYGFDAALLLREILNWTNGQPFLTQKLCSLTKQTLQVQGKEVRSRSPSTGKSPASLRLLSRGGLPTSEAALVEQVVYTRVIDHWESQDDPEHLRTIRDRLLRDELQAPRLLGIYETILTASNAVGNVETGEVEIVATCEEAVTQSDQSRQLVYDDSPEHLDLLLSGLIGLYRGQLAVKNRIYRTIFDIVWVREQLSQLRPYAKQLSAWVSSGQTDDSRLLRGKALKDAQAWSQARSIGEIDHDFLMASERYDRQIVQQRLKSARLKEVEKRLELERRTRRRQRGFIAALSGALGVAIVLGTTAYVQFQQALSSQLEALVTTSEALYSSDQRLDALLQAVEAERFSKRNFRVPEALSKRLDAALRTAAVSVVERNRLTLVDSNFWDVDVHASEDYIATASADTKVRLWTQRGELLDTLLGHRARVRAVAFSPYEPWLASASDDRYVKLWTLDGQLIRTLRGHTDAVYDVAVSPNGQLLASASGDRTVKLWRKDGTLLQTLEGHTGEVLAVAFSPDGKTLASAGEDRTIKLWSTETTETTEITEENNGELLKTFEGHSEAITAIAFSLGGQRIASSSRDSTLKLWSASTGEVLHTMRGHQGDVLSVAFSPDGKQLASASRDKTVKLWNLKGEVISTLQGHRGRVSAVNFLPNSRVVVSAAFDRTVRLWDLRNLLQTQYIGSSEGIVGVDISPDNLLVAASSDDGSLYVWQRETTRQIGRYRHPSSVLSVAFSPDSQTVITGTWGGTARLWDLTGQQLRVLSHPKPVWDAVFSADGQTIATGSADGKVRLWDLLGQQKARFSGHNGEVRAVDFSADGQYVLSASLDKSVKLWDMEGRLLRIFNSPEQSGFIDANFSPDGKYIAAAGFDNKARVWTIDGEAVATMDGHTAEVRSVSFSSDSQQVVTAGGDGQVKVWNLEGELISTLRGEGEAIWQALFAERAGGEEKGTGGTALGQNRTVVAAGENGRATLWALDQVLDETGLITTSCEWVSDYLQTSLDPDVSQDVCEELL